MSRTPSTQPSCVAVTGLRTFLGRQLVGRLLERGGIRVVGIDHQRPWGLPASVRYHGLDLCRPTADGDVAEVLHEEGVEVFVHLAFRREPTPDLEADHELETIGSLHVLDACGSADVRRVVLASTTMAYGARADNPNYLTEEHPLRGHPAAHNVMNRVEVETLAHDWAQRDPARCLTVLRHCWMMGPEHRDAVVRYFARPVVPMLLGYDPLLQLVHEDDCLAAFEHAILEPTPGAFNVVGRGVQPLSKLIRHAGKRALPVPAPLMQRLRHVPSYARTGDRPEGFYDYLRYLWVADGSKGFDAFGEPEFTTGEAWTSFVSSEKLRQYA